MICDSTVLCNDLFECLNKKSKTDEKSKTTYKIKERLK